MSAGFAVPALLALALAAALGMVAGVAAAADPPAAANLLANPSFEDPGTLAMPAGWDSTPGDLPTARYTWDDTQARTGRRSVHVVNTSDYFPSWHNWNQTLLGVEELAGKEVTLRGWYKARDLAGKAYILVQAYRDTVFLESVKQGTPRRRMREIMGFTPQNDPALELGWGRKYASGDRGEWTPLEVTIYVPPSTNVIFVRAGVLGVGEAWFDDFSLTAGTPAPEKPFPPGRNLLVDPGFEGNLDEWEFSFAPVENSSIQVDTVAHSGLQSVRVTAPHKPDAQIWMNVSQAFNTRMLSGKRVRLTGWIKTRGVDNSYALINVFTTGMYGTRMSPGSEAFSGTTEWQKSSVEFDVPKDTYTVWVRGVFSTAKGEVWFDDLDFQVVGDTPPPDAPASSSSAR